MTERAQPLERDRLPFGFPGDFWLLSERVSFFLNGGLTFLNCVRLKNYFLAHTASRFFPMG